jgi:hypothetical protein
LVMMIATVVLGFMPQLMDWVTVPAAQTLIAMFGK